MEVGDRVLLRNREKGGTGKLRNFWEEKVYTVVKKDEEIPVITIKPEAGGKEKRVHRNNLLKCNFILPENHKEKEAKPKSKPKGKESQVAVQPPQTEAVKKHPKKLPQLNTPITQSKTIQRTQTKRKQETANTTSQRKQTKQLEQSDSDSEESECEYVVVSQPLNDMAAHESENEDYDVRSNEHAVEMTDEGNESVENVVDVEDDEADNDSEEHLEADVSQDSLTTGEPSFSLEEGEEVPESPPEVDPDEETENSLEPEVPNPSESDNESDSSSESEHRRYPNRTRSRATRFTYDSIGGNPSYTNC